MKCPHCGRLDENSKVTDSRPYKHTIKRRRECSFCHHRWSTFEATENQFFSERNRNKYLPWSPVEERTAMIMAFDAKSRVAIAKVLGRNRTSVGRKLDKLVGTERYYAVVNAELIQRKKEKNYKEIKIENSESTWF
jgi:transcriptional regulator NrdR family protein